MLDVRPAGEWVTRGSKHRTGSTEMFGTLWREGEVAVLFGDKGSGKSVLAVQIAEAIARGTKAVANTKNWSGSVAAQPKPRKVLYIDFQRTQRQFAERYSARPRSPASCP